MNKKRSREIELLKNRLAILEEEEQREQQEREILEEIYLNLKNELGSNNLTLDSFVKAFYIDFQKTFVMVEGDAKRSTTAKTTSRKHGKRKPKRKPSMTIKIPAGKYSNIPPDTKRIIEVKEKGPRPKLLKAHAEMIGIEEFMEQCLVG